MFVRKSAGRSGATKVQIAERRDGRIHIVEDLGTARSQAELAVLIAEARLRLRPGQEALDLNLDEEGGGASSRSEVITGKQSALLWQVLSSVCDRLGFDVVDNDAFKELVLARTIEPTSKVTRCGYGRGRDRARVAAHDVPHPGPSTIAREGQEEDEAGQHHEEVGSGVLTDNPGNHGYVRATRELPRVEGEYQQEGQCPEPVHGLDPARVVSRYGSPMHPVNIGPSGCAA